MFGPGIAVFEKKIIHFPFQPNQKVQYLLTAKHIED